MKISLDNFIKIYGSLGNMDALRNKIIDLAIVGRLSNRVDSDITAKVMLEKIKNELVQKNKSKKIVSRYLDLENNMGFVEPFEIPAEWGWFPIGMLGITQTGSTPSKKNQLFYGGDIPFVKPDDIYYDRINTTTKLFLTESGAKKGRIAKKNTLLMVCIGTIGKANVVDREVSFNQQINALTPYAPLNVKLIHYFTQSKYFQNLIRENSSATTISIINKSKWEQLYLPVPMMHEQKEIVDNIESLLSKVDQLEAKLKRKEELLKLLPEAAVNALGICKTSEELKAQSEFVIDNFETIFQTPESMQDLRNIILQLAIEGKLVPQDDNDEPVSVLLNRIKAERDLLVMEKKIRKPRKLDPISSEEIPFVIPDSWEWERLGNLLNKLTDGAHKTPQYTDAGIPFLSVKDMSSGELSFSETRFISEDTHRVLYKRCNPQKGDLLVTKVGTTGVPVIVNSDREFSLFVSVALLKFSQKDLDVHYLKHFFNSPYIKKLSAENTRGVGNKNLVLRDIANFVFPVPPKKEQERIVARIESLFEIVNSLEVLQKKKRRITEIMGTI